MAELDVRFAQGPAGDDPWPVEVTNFPDPPAFPETQTDALTDAELRAAPVATLARLADENGAPYTEANPLPVDIGGAVTINELSVSFESVISTVNSTSTPLGAGEMFLGQWEDVKDYATIQAVFKTDADSAPNGAMIEFSENGVDPITVEAGTVPGGIGGFSALAPQARYFRVRYVNGPVAQTYLRAEVGYFFNAPAVTQTAIGGATSDLSIATLTKAHMQGRVMSGPFTGLWGAIGTDGAGRMLVSIDPQDYPAPQTDALTDAELRAAPIEVDTGLVIPAPQTDALTDAELRASDVQVADDYDTASHAADQTGAEAVLTFTVAAGKMVMVDVDPASPTDTDNYRARATVDGSTPTATLGFVCRPGTTYIPVACAGTVKVHAPAGIVVAVQSLGRA